MIRQDQAYEYKQSIEDPDMREFFGYVWQRSSWLGHPNACVLYEPRPECSGKNGFMAMNSTVVTPYGDVDIVWNTLGLSTKPSMISPLTQDNEPADVWIRRRLEDMAKAFK